MVPGARSSMHIYNFLPIVIQYSNGFEFSYVHLKNRMIEFTRTLIRFYLYTVGIYLESYNMYHNTYQIAYCVPVDLTRVLCQVLGANWPCNASQG